MALVVRFVPFSQLVDWVTETPFIDRGLNPNALAVPSFRAELEAGAFDESGGATDLQPKNIFIQTATVLEAQLLSAQSFHYLAPLSQPSKADPFRALNVPGEVCFYDLMAEETTIHVETKREPASEMGQWTVVFTPVPDIDAIRANRLRTFRREIATSMQNLYRSRAISQSALRFTDAFKVTYAKVAA